MKELAFKDGICKSIHLLQDFLLPLCYWQLPGIFTSLGEVKAVDEVLLVLLGAAKSQE